MSRIIYNKWLPLKGFLAINLFGFIFVRHGNKLNEVEINHERIHTRQQLEMLVVPFYIAYLAEWLYHLVRVRNGMKAYYLISFEKEAYRHQNDLGYLQRRKRFAWIRKNN